MQAKIFARLMDWAPTPSSLPDGSLLARIEWTRLHGGRESGKMTVVIDEVVSGRRLATDLVDAVVTELNGKYPGNTYRERDVVLWGV